MNIALWFPLIYYLKQTEIGRYLSNKVSLYWKKIRNCKFGEHKSDKRKNNCDDEIKMDVEYMSLISSLEIVIIFGWSIPLLIFLYLITIFSYWSVYSYWFNNETNKFRNRHQLYFVTNGLFLSLIFQHILSISFYGYTQSRYHAIICVIILFVNIVLVFILVCFEYIFKMLFCFK